MGFTGTAYIDNLEYPGCAGGCGTPTTTIQPALVRTCSFGCNPTLAACFPDCRPGSTKTCTQQSIFGVQTCQANGTWGSCIPDPSSLCRTPPNVASFSGSTTKFSDLLSADAFLNLRSLSGMTLEVPGKVKIDYRSEVDVCGVDLDSSIRSGPGFLAVNGGALPTSISQPTQQAHVEIFGIEAVSNPKIYYSAGFQDNAAQVIALNQLCPPEKCQNVQYLPGKVTFDATSFSSFAVGQDSTIAPTPPPIVNPSAIPTTQPSTTPGGATITGTSPQSQIRLECPPGGLVSEDKTDVFVHYFDSGQTRCASGFITLTAIGNGTAKTSTFQNCNPKTGKHTYQLDTSVSGAYHVNVSSPIGSSFCSFEAAQKRPTPASDMDLILIVATALLAYGILVRTKKAKNRKKAS